MNFSVTFALAAFIFSGTVALAQNAPGGIYLGGANPPVPGTTVRGTKTCVQVEIAGQKASAYDCLNQELQRQALSAGAGGLPVVPLGAGSPSNAVGTFNEQGVREQYGQNFGKSAEPYRPPPPVFAGGLSTK